MWNKVPFKARFSGRNHSLHICSWQTSVSLCSTILILGYNNKYFLIIFYIAIYYYDYPTEKKSLIRFVTAGIIQNKWHLSNVAKGRLFSSLTERKTYISVNFFIMSENIRVLFSHKFASLKLTNLSLQTRKFWLKTQKFTPHLPFQLVFFSPAMALICHHRKHSLFTFSFLWNFKTMLKILFIINGNTATV